MQMFKRKPRPEWVPDGASRVYWSQHMTLRQRRRDRITGRARHNPRHPLVFVLRWCRSLKPEFNGIGGLRTYNKGRADIRHFSPLPVNFGPSSPPNWGRFFGGLLIT